MALFRVQPALEVGAYRTFRMARPTRTHTRVATCLEVGCEAQEHGWVTNVDENTLLGQRQAHYVRSLSGRSYRETRMAGLTSFTFPPGQQCFAEHRVSLERPEIFTVRPGDWRVQPARHEIYTHANADNWVDEFANNQIALAELVNRG